jgi:hypothetical protein
MPLKLTYQSAEGTGSLAEANYLDVAIEATTWTDYNAQVLTEAALESSKAVTFYSQFDGCMELKGDRTTVMNYLDAHQGWFCRCAEPMEVEAIGNNGYAITVGHYGSHGFMVEPKIALHLLPHEHGIYRIETLPLPDNQHQCYEVDFDANLHLVESEPTSETEVLTQVQWTLDLSVKIHFPAFIYRLPHKLIQYTGDQVLNQIVKQVSKRLTAKVKNDFHQTLLKAA